MFSRFILLVFVLLALLSGCAVNPVTGEKQLILISEQQELAIGENQYAPARQTQGGDYVADPALGRYVNQVGQRLAAVSDRKLPYEFIVLNSSVPNAWALPGGKITINRGLLTELKTEAELAAVLGHEIVHAAAMHGAQGLTRGMLLQSAVVGVTLATSDQDYGQWAQMGAGVGAQLITQRYGRDAEREADHYGMLYMSRAGYDPQGAVDLQRTFLALQDGQRQDFISGLFASHPPSQERLENNIAMLAELPKGGEVGRQTYQARIAQLMKTKPAYEAFDKGRQALTDKAYAKAKSLAQQAIRLEPKEAIFYGLIGDAEQKNKRLSAAVSQYNKAIDLNPGYFYHYLQRGKTYEQLNRPKEAELDLKYSTELLPTADAYYLLGNISQSSGRLSEAKGYYAKIASTSNEIGKQAYGALVDLDLDSNPGEYLSVRSGQDKDGRILAEVSNPTPRVVGNIQLVVTYRDGQGKNRTMSLRLPGQVAAESKRVFDLGIADKLASEKAQSFGVKISAAGLMK